MVTTARTQLHRAALAYAEQGIPVFPLAPRTKKPAVRDWPNQATTNPAQIAEWWTRWPDANIGAPTGARSGWFVLDEDPRHDGDETRRDLEHKHGRLPDTPTSLTGGGGSQYFLSDPDGQLRNTASKLGPGLDTRGAGGFVVLPPSVHPSGTPYTWDAGARFGEVALAPVPEWLRAKLTEAAPRPTPALTEDWQIPAGRRNQELFNRAAKLRRDSHNEIEIAAFLLEVNRQRCDPPLPEREVQAIAASAARYDPTNVPDFSEEAEESARHENERLRALMQRRHDFEKSTGLRNRTEKQLGLTLARLLPTLPFAPAGRALAPPRKASPARRSRTVLPAGTQQLSPTWLHNQAGSGDASQFLTLLENAGIVTVYQTQVAFVIETQAGRLRTQWRTDTYVKLREDIDLSEAAILTALSTIQIERPSHGGYRPRTITTVPVPPQKLRCATDGDAGTITRATTYCAICGEVVYDHDPITHQAGWLSDDDGPEPPPEPIDFQDEKRYGWQSDASEDDPASPPEPSDFQVEKRGPTPRPTPGSSDFQDENQSSALPSIPKVPSLLTTFTGQVRNRLDDPEPPDRPRCIACGQPLEFDGVEHCKRCWRRPDGDA